MQPSPRSTVDERSRTRRRRREATSGRTADGDGQRGRQVARGHGPRDHGARRPAWVGADRGEGGLRRGRVRRLRRDGRATGRCGGRHRPRHGCRSARRAGHRPQPVGRRQRVPRSGRGPRRPGGRDGRGPGHPRVTPPGPARDGRARWVAVRLLHPGVRLLDGRRVLPRRPRTRLRLRRLLLIRLCLALRDRDRDPDGRARPQRLRPARPERQPVPLHGLPPDP